MNKKKNRKKGISMIVVLWIMAILTVLTTATALMTQGDVASTINLIKRKGALQLAETGSDYFVSMIPMFHVPQSMLDTILVKDTAHMTLESGGVGETVHRVYMNDDSSKSFVIAPVPHNSPYWFSPGSGEGTYRLYSFTAGGFMGGTENVESPQKVVDVEAGVWSALGAGDPKRSGGGTHTMY